MQKISDTSLGVDTQARTILALLAGHEPTFAEFDGPSRRFDVTIQTRAFYEEGSGWAALVLYPSLHPEGECKIIVFGEDFRSTDIVVQSWKPLDLRGRQLGPDLVERECEPVHFRPADLNQAVNYILQELRDAYKAFRFRDRAAAATLVEAVMEDG